MIYYDSKSNIQLEDVSLKVGKYLFEYPILEYKEAIELTEKKFPLIQTANGKKFFVNGVYISGNKLIMQIEIIENPIPLIPIIYVLGGILISWLIDKFVGHVEKITDDVTEVINPTNLILVIIGIIVLTPILMKR